MTLIDALETLKAKGITKLTGMYNVSDIERYISNAVQCHEDSVRWADVPCHKYSLDHEDDHYMIETNGHYIIVTKCDGFDMPTYGDYDNDEEMTADFDEWRIVRDAESIADEMTATRPGELPRAAWVLIAANELRAANKAATEAFEREYGN